MVVYRVSTNMSSNNFTSDINLSDFSFKNIWDSIDLNEICVKFSNLVWVSPMVLLLEDLSMIPCTSC